MYRRLTTIGLITLLSIPAPGQTTSKPEEPPPTPARPKSFERCPDILADYRKDEAAAGRKYKNVWWEWEGVVTLPVEGPADRPYAILTEGDIAVTAAFDGESKEALEKSLKKVGQRVKIRGCIRGGGCTRDKSVLLVFADFCQVVAPSGKSTPPNQSKPKAKSKARNKGRRR